MNAGIRYQWAATLTTSGQNLPFVLPMKTDKVEDGFMISMCNLQDEGGLVSVGDIQGTVEEVPGVVRLMRMLCRCGMLRSTCNMARQIIVSRA